MIDIPEEHQLRMQILVLPQHDINIAMGSDYTGEYKRASCARAMYRADLRGMLGLHAGTKVVKARDYASGKVKTYGAFSCSASRPRASPPGPASQPGLDADSGEGHVGLQDDIVILQSADGRPGTEQGFYGKTDVDPNLQEAMYYSLAHKSALLENVMVDGEGKINFLDERLGENGRGVLDRRELKVKRGGKMVSICADSIDLPDLDHLDGLVFAFITRPGTIMPLRPAPHRRARVLAYLWGESTHSFATVPEKAGESVRIVGMDDFIVGPSGPEGEHLPRHRHGARAEASGQGSLLPVQHRRHGRDHRRGQSHRKAQAGAQGLPRAPGSHGPRSSGATCAARTSIREGASTEYVVKCEGADITPYDPKNFDSDEQIAATYRTSWKGGAPSPKRSRRRASARTSATSPTGSLTPSRAARRWSPGHR